MKIYTKTGDTGETSLIGGKRVKKNHLRLNAYGTIDELNANIGFLCDFEIDTTTIRTLRTVQSRLFDLGANLACENPELLAKIPQINEAEIQEIENEIDAIERTLPKLTNFILPGGSKEASVCHICRTVCRRAERLCVELAGEDPINMLIIKYLNRLSDYFFVLSRKLLAQKNIEPTYWKPK